MNLNASEVKAFDPVYSLLKKLDPKILENIHSFYLEVVIGTKCRSGKPSNRTIKKCKNLSFFQCGGIGINTTFELDALSISSFKSSGDITKNANLQLTNLTHFKCFDIKDEATLKLKKLHHFVCHDIFHTNFEFSRYKFLTTIKVQHIKSSASVVLKNLPNLISFECSDINGSLQFTKNLNNLESIKVGNLTLKKERGMDNYQQGQLLLSEDLTSLTVFECGDVEGSINFYGEANNLKSIKCGSLKRKEIKAPKPKPTKSKSQVSQHYSEKNVFNGKLRLPRELPSLTSLDFRNIEVDDDNFDIPNTPKLEKISFGKVHQSLAKDLKKLQESIIKNNNAGNIDDEVLSDQSSS